MTIHRKSWLKQLRVAISTRASVPSGSSPQNSQANFVDLHHINCDFKTREKFLKSADGQDDRIIIKFL
jgi:hypothetical protein